MRKSNCFSYNNKLEDLKCDLEEVKAYRSLQDKPFDFGNGLITNDSCETEEAIYEMEEQNLEEFIDSIVYDRERNQKPKKSKRLDRYSRKQKGKSHFERLAKQGVYFVYETENEQTGKKYVKRLYLSGCRKLAKRETNRKVRNSKNDFSLKGGGYRKKFDYWWTLF